MFVELALYWTNFSPENGGPFSRPPQKKEKQNYSERRKFRRSSFEAAPVVPEVAGRFLKFVITWQASEAGVVVVLTQ